MNRASSIARRCSGEEKASLSGFFDRPPVFLQAGEVGGVADALADVDAGDAERDGEQERDAPAPRLHAVLAESAGHGGGDQGAGEQGEERGDLGVARVEAALALGGVLGEEAHRAGGLAADREALGDAQQDQQGGAAMPMLAYVGRTPIAAVATLISMMTKTSMRWRPMRSPRWPQMIPPRGRKKNETA
jgi:hypothetical protein